MDYEIKRCTRHCSVTGRELQEGEEFFSALVPEGSDVGRVDFSTEAWSGPPEGALGWWKSQMPTKASRRARMAPNEVLLDLFHELQNNPAQQDMCYVLALLLVRRRLFRLEEFDEEPEDEDAGEVMVVYSPREEATYRIQVAVPEEARVVEIQDQLANLLFADAK